MLVYQVSIESEVFSLETACLTVSVKDWADATGMKLDVLCPYSESGCSKSTETKPFTHTANITSSGCFLKFNAWPCHQGFHIFVSHGLRMNSLILISLVHTGFEHIFHKRRVARVSGTCLRIPCLSMLDWRELRSTHFLAYFCLKAAWIPCAVDLLRFSSKHFTDMKAAITSSVAAFGVSSNAWWNRFSSSSTIISIIQNSQLFLPGESAQKPANHAELRSM